MPGLEIQSTGEIIATYNGDVVEDAKWNMDYDGENMDIETLHNNEMTFIQLDNNDLRRLFRGIGSQQEKGLSERLKRDFVQGSVHAIRSSPKRSSPKRSRQGSAPDRRSSPKRSRSKTKRVRFMDDHLRKSGKQKQKIVIKKQGSVHARRSSPKRSSPKRSSPKRSSPKRSSPKRSSPKRGSAPMRRSSPKRSSPKRKRSSSKRRSPKSSSKKKTRKRELRKEDQDFIFDSRPDIEKTIY